MVDALTISALGHETDGNPSETSERVRTAARISLTRALASAVAQYPQEYVSLVHVTPKTDPTGMQSIMPISRLPEPAISPEERRRAETVGIPARQPQPTGGVRSISDWFQIIAWWRRPSSQADVDPRLRGLQPLGSDGTLAIPVSP
jgi:hypothetical protein